jgi:hypothetical protein
VARDRCVSLLVRIDEASEKHQRQSVAAEGADGERAQDEQSCRCSELGSVCSNK